MGDVCPVCGSSDDEPNLLLCDECDQAYHIYCLDPPLSQAPKEDWYCRSCSVRPLFGTVWVPLEDIPIHKGTLGLILGSHKMASFDKPIRDTSLPGSYTYSRRPRGGKWLTTSFRSGDVVLFDIKTIHATSKNNSLESEFRYSCDTRWCIRPT